MPAMSKTSWNIVWRCHEKGAGEASNKGNYHLCGYEGCWQGCKEGMSQAISRVTIFILLCYRKVYLETWRMIAMMKGTLMWVSFFTLMILSLIFLQNLNGLMKVVSKLVHLHGLLEKKYSNNHNSGYIYIDAISLESIPLTPFMMKEWACALVSNIFFSHINILKIDISLQYDGSVSISHPPSTMTFDPVNHRSSLHTCLQNPHHLESASTPASSQGAGISGDLAHTVSCKSFPVWYPWLAFLQSLPQLQLAVMHPCLHLSYVHPLRIPLQSCLNFLSTQK